MQYIGFGKTVEHRLVDLGQSKMWLIQKVREKTGMYLDSSYLSRILRGKRTPERIVSAICEVLDIVEP